MASEKLEVSVDKLQIGDRLDMSVMVQDGIYTIKFFKGQFLTDDSIQILKESDVKKVMIDTRYRDQTLRPLHIKTIRTIDLVPGMKLVNNVYTDRGVLITPNSKEIDENIINKLLMLNIRKVDIQEDKRLKDNLYHVFEGIYVNIKKVLTALFKNLLAEKPIDIKNLLLSITDIIIAAAMNPHNLTKLLQDKDTEEFPLIEHSSRVAVLSLLIGLYLNMERDDLMHLGISALLHDIGKFKIPPRLWKMRVLKPHEKEIMNRHTEYGYVILSNIKKFDYRVPIVALQHHEFFDGSGFPTGLTEDMIDPFSQIVGLANYYANKIESADETDKDVYYNALIDIIMNRGTKFDKRITNTFLSMIGYYPVNTIVELNTGQTARIVKIVSNAIFRPEITIIKDANERKLDTPVLLKLVEHPEISIEKNIQVGE
ncbi:MAG: HD domain-containing protein [Spirochaetes bacterium]|nr:HD domain-containing protein [Spirochaetota bacterium]